MDRFKNFRIDLACPLLVIVKRLKPLTVLSGTVYRLAGFMSNPTLVLFNVFEDWNEESVVPHISCFICNLLLTTERPIQFAYRWTVVERVKRYIGLIRFEVRLKCKRPIWRSPLFTV